jgi:hypothetical protein
VSFLLFFAAHSHQIHHSQQAQLLAELNVSATRSGTRKMKPAWGRLANLAGRSMRTLCFSVYLFNLLCLPARTHQQTPAHTHAARIMLPASAGVDSHKFSI